MLRLCVSLMLIGLSLASGLVACDGPVSQPSLEYADTDLDEGEACIHTPGRLCDGSEGQEPFGLEDTGEWPAFGRNRLEGEAAFHLGLVHPVEGGLITSGFLVQGPVTGVHLLADVAARCSGDCRGTAGNDAGYGENGFASAQSDQVTLHDGDDWAEPVMVYDVSEGPNGSATDDLNGDGVDDIAWKTPNCEYNGHGRAGVVDGSGAELHERC